MTRTEKRARECIHTHTHALDQSEIIYQKQSQRLFLCIETKDESKTFYPGEAFTLCCFSKAPLIKRNCDVKDHIAFLSVSLHARTTDAYLKDTFDKGDRIGL